MSGQHTPGPWAKMAQDIYAPSIASAKNTGMVCEVTMCEEWEANARLIAAAPELLEAAINLNLTFKSYGKARLPEYVRKEFAPLLAAIAKAEGGAA